MGSLAKYVKFWEADPRKWAQCLEQAGKSMLAEGWVQGARKFSEVRRKRAMRLWSATCSRCGCTAMSHSLRTGC